MGLIVEPKHFSEAVKSTKWQQARKLEFDTLEMNHTWTVMPLLIDKHTIWCKWVYRVNYKANSTVERYKAKLLLKVIHNNGGFTTWKYLVMLLR